MEASQRRCPGLLVWGKLICLCQHPNKASKIFTNLLPAVALEFLRQVSTGLISNLRHFLGLLLGNGSVQASTFVTDVIVVGSLTSFHAISHKDMTQIVSFFVCCHHFQYVERRYSGFVALRIVACVRFDANYRGISCLPFFGFPIRFKIVLAQIRRSTQGTKLSRFNLKIASYPTRLFVYSAQSIRLAQEGAHECISYR
jgi:hypothetical protein